MSYIKVGNIDYHSKTGEILSLEDFTDKYGAKLVGHDVKAVWVKLGGKVKASKKKKEETSE